MITIPENFAEESKIWIYQSDRKLTDSELSDLKLKLTSFAANWVSHNNQLKAFATIYLNQIMVLMVDETQASASGCSIDSSVAFVKKMGQQLEIDFFNRWNFLFLDSEKNIQAISKNQIQHAFNQGIIDLDTPFIDPLVKNLSEFKEGFIKALKDSWHKNFLDVEN